MINSGRNIVLMLVGVVMAAAVGCEDKQAQTQSSPPSQSAPTPKPAPEEPASSLSWAGPYTSASQTNPTGPATGSHRLLRGGGWSSYAGTCRASKRINTSPDDIHYGFGFRVVRTP